VYWGANGLGVWVLAHAFGLPLSLVGAYATMCLLGVGISLPNAPGLVGQFQWFTLLGLSLYLGFDLGDPATKHTTLYAVALAFAIVQHLLQVAWYVAMGALGLASPWVSFHDLWSARKVVAEEDEPAVEPAAPAEAAPPPAPPPASADARRREDKKLAL
jgi:glycosyltransferase 2 family protein